MKNLIFIAPPAAGKGTQSLKISKRYNIPSISTGELLRDIKKEDSEIGKLVKEKLEQGLLVDDELVLKILKERLSKEDCKNGYILDGFPRNIKQAESYDNLLDEMGRELGVVILLDIDKEIAKRRIVGRLSCSSCKEIYNTLSLEMKPKVENICDYCGKILIKRSDDNDEVFEKRYKEYIEKTAPLIDYYKKKGNLYIVNSGISKEYTDFEVERILNDQNS